MCWRSMLLALHGLDEYLAHGRALLGRDLTLADPEAVMHGQRLVLRQVVLEVGADPAVRPLALPGLLRVGRVVQVHARVPLPADHEAHRRPRPVLRALLALRLPVHLL